MSRSEPESPKRPKGNLDFLSARLYVSYPVLRRLEAAAVVHDFPSADAYCNHLLLGALEQEPQEVAELDAAIQRLRQEARDKFEQRQQQHETT